MAEKTRIFGTWHPPAGEKPAQHLEQPAKEEQSWDQGGTAHLLPAERSKASFDTFKLTLFLDDDNPEITAKRRWLWRAGETYDHSKNADMTRAEKLSWHIETFLGIHRKFADEGYNALYGVVVTCCFHMSNLDLQTWISPLLANFLSVIVPKLAR